MADHRTVRIALIQHACSPSAGQAEHLGKATEMIRHAAGQGAHIIATQELFGSHYFPQAEDEANFALAESIPGPTSQAMCTLAAELDVAIIASLFERRAAGVYHNTTLIIDGAKGIVGKYRKMHIPHDPRFYEKYYFTPGDADDPGWTVEHVRGAAVGVLVCWDQWFPEAARLSALNGAQIIFCPTAIGWYHGETSEDRAQQKDAWRTIQRSHAIANGMFFAPINRVGVEADLQFWGDSFVADPGGTVIAEAGQDEEAVVIADCDLGLVDEYRNAWPFLRDRRVDAYGQITRRMADS